MPESLPTPPARRRLLCAAILGALAGCSRPPRPDTLRAAPGSLCLREDAVPVAYPFSLRTILRASKSRSQPAAFAMAEPRRGYGYAEATGTDTPVFWDVTFRFDTCDARRFQMWFVLDLERGVLEFTLPIRTEFGVLDHTCRFLPDGLLDCTEDGELWTYRARIMARAQVIPSDAVTAYAATFSGPIPDQTIYVGLAYTLALSGYFSGGVGPYTYSVFSGTLPPGMTLDAATGVLSCTPTSLVDLGPVVFMREDAYCAKLWTSAVTFTPSATPTADPLAAYVISLVMAQVSSGATTFPDSIAANMTPVRDSSSPTGSTAVAPPFGSGTALFGGTVPTSSLLVVPNASWIGTGQSTFHATPFCFDVWIYPTSISTREQCIGGDDFTSGSTSFNGYFVLFTNGSIGWSHRGGTGGSTAAGLVTNNAWHHIAVTGNGVGTYTIWINGVSRATISSAPYTAQNSGNWLWGEQNGTQAGFERNFIGHMKAMRITWGHRRFTAAFTPPSTLGEYALS